MLREGFSESVLQKAVRLAIQRGIKFPILEDVRDATIEITAAPRTSPSTGIKFPVLEDVRDAAIEITENDETQGDCCLFMTFRHKAKHWDLAVIQRNTG